MADPLPAIPPLPKDATIRSIVGSVTEEYVRAVLEKVQQCEREMADALVSIDLAKGVDRPNYCIDAVMDLESRGVMNWQNFSGKTHRPLSEKQERESAWSCRSMTWRELSELIGEIRNFQSKKRPVQP